MRRLLKWTVYGLVGFFLVIGIVGALLPPVEENNPRDKPKQQAKGAAQKPGESAQEPTPAPKLEEPPGEATATAAAQTPEPASPEPVSGLTISRVIDGDTLELSETVEGTDTVRLIGIDAPEECQPLGSDATTELSMYEGEGVRLEFDEDPKDQYGRLLAYAHITDILDQKLMLNEEMLRAGLAQVYTVPPNDKYEDRFLKAQQAAKNEDFAIFSIWALSRSEKWQLADHGNGIGNGDGSCEPEPITPAPSTASPSTASPSPAPDEDPNRDGGGDGSPAPSSPEPAVCESGVPAPYPNHPKDGDNDGCINE